VNLPAALPRNLVIFSFSRCSTPDDDFPQRFRPVDSSGRALSGPRITRGGKPWNRGRQYFSSFVDGDFSSFIWADGVKAMEPEAQQSFNEAFGLW